MDFRRNMTTVLGLFIFVFSPVHSEEIDRQAQAAKIIYEQAEQDNCLLTGPERGRQQGHEVIGAPGILIEPGLEFRTAFTPDGETLLIFLKEVRRYTYGVVVSDILYVDTTNPRCVPVKELVEKFLKERRVTGRDVD